MSPAQLCDGSELVPERSNDAFCVCYAETSLTCKFNGHILIA